MSRFQAAASRLRRLSRLARAAVDPAALGVDDIFVALRELGPPGSITMVHSSLSACGPIAGGAATVIAALRQWVDTATLAMPTHTYCYPNVDGQAPLFDPDNTPSVVGAVTEMFRRLPGARRSLHPTHSLAALGPGADTLVANHQHATTPCGASTPYRRLVDEDGSVLMFGASFDAYTLFHTAEDEAGVPYLYQRDPVHLRYLVRGELPPSGAPSGIVEMIMRRQDMNVERVFSARASFLEGRGLLVRRRLGRGWLLFVPSAKAAHEQLVARLRAQPEFLVRQ